MSFEQPSANAENEIIIEKRSWFGISVKFTIRAKTVALPDILKLCDRHLNGIERSITGEIKED